MTSLQVIEDKNVERRHTIRITGDKSFNSVQNYTHLLSARRKRNISASFSHHLLPVSEASASKVRKSDVPVRNKEIFSSLANDVTVNVSSSKNNAMCAPEPQKHLVDFEKDDVDDVSLSQVPSELLEGFNFFSNCNNCSFTFHVHLHQK